MKRLLGLALLAVSLVGCGRQQPPQIERPIDPDPAVGMAKAKVDPANKKGDLDVVLTPAAATKVRALQRELKVKYLRISASKLGPKGDYNLKLDLDDAYDPNADLLTEVQGVQVV